MFIQAANLIKKIDHHKTSRMYSSSTYSHIVRVTYKKLFIFNNWNLRGTLFHVKTKYDADDTQESTF